MNCDNYKYSCITDTPYSLFLYMLMCEDGDWDRTVFFVGDGIEETYLKHLKKVVRFSSNYHHYATRAQLLRIKMRAWYYRCRYISHTKLYAQDHLVFSSQLIGGKKYTMVEDAPGSYTTCLSTSVRDVLQIPTRMRPKLRRLLLWGPVYGQFFGRNAYCEDRWVTEKSDELSPVLRGRKYTLLNLHKLWDEASEQKKKFILSIFGVEEEQLASVSKCKTIILTEALSEDGITEEEAASIFAPYVEKYKKDGVVIKPHPRDYMKWKDIFPEAVVLKTRIPMQVLSIIGTEFERAVAIFSTAISSMNADTEIIWLGASVHPKLAAIYGKKRERFCPFEGKFKKIVYP